MSPRSLKTAAGLVAALAVAYTGASWYAGRLAQERIEAWVERANQEIAAQWASADPRPVLTIQDYRRGVFASDIRYGFQFRDEAGRDQTLGLQDALVHGPWPWAAVRQGEWRPAAAWSRIEPLPGGSWQPWFDALPAGTAPWTLRSRIGFDGGVVAHWGLEPVRHAIVRRVWPATLQVRIEEQQPLAYWNENQMINTWGEAFTANQGELPDGLNLPQLNGPVNSERLVVQRYAEIARWFAPLGLNVREATLTPRYAWEVTLSDDVRLTLGRDPAADVADPHGRSGALPFAARIERFVQAWPELTRRLGGRMIASADLRYPNGFAITLSPEISAPSRSTRP